MSVYLSPRSSYPTGGFVVQQNGHRTAAWTRHAWQRDVYDLAFRMVLVR
jgi:hypothetical protein